MKKHVFRVLLCLTALMLCVCGSLVGVSAAEPIKPAVTDISWNGDLQPKPNTDVTFTVHLKGNGGAISKGTAITVDLYLDSQKLFTQIYTQGIASGQTVRVEFPKWKAVAGDHTVTAVLNGTVPTRQVWNSGLHYIEHIRVAKTALSVPAVAQKNGMNTLTFSDDFTTLATVDGEATGGYGYKWYTHRPYGATTLKTTDYQLTADGILLKAEIPTYNYGLCTFDCKTGAGWAGYTHGYMEMRLRMPTERVIADTKGSPAVWSLPPEKLMGLSGYNSWVELDFMEYWGNNSFSTTLHDQQYTDDTQKEQVHWYKNSNFNAVGLGDGGWHTMGFLWSEGVMQSYLDGEEFQALYWAPDEKSYPEAMIQKGDNATAKGAFAFMDQQLIPLIIGGAEGWSMELDYIRVWQNDGKATVPAGPGPVAAKFIDMYLRDDEGKVLTAVNFETYESILNLGDSWNELTAAQKSGVDRVLKAQSGKTLSQVLNDAKQFQTNMESFIAQFASDKAGGIAVPEGLTVCRTIAAGEATWKAMSAELRDAINKQVYLLSGGVSTYESLLAQAKAQLPKPAGTTATTVGDKVTTSKTHVGGAVTEPDAETQITVEEDTGNTTEGTTVREDEAANAVPKRKGGFTIWLLLSVMAVVVLAGGAVWFVWRKKQNMEMQSAGEEAPILTEKPGNFENKE